MARLKKLLKKYIKYLTRRNLIIAVIAVFFLFQFIQVQILLGTFSFLEGRNSSFITEIGQIKSSFSQLGGDLKEVRAFLRMPANNYTGFQDSEEHEDDENTNDVQLAIFKYLEYLNANNKINSTVALNKSFLNDLYANQEFQSFLSGNDLLISAPDENDQSISLNINDTSGRNLAFFYLDKTDGTLLRKTINEKTEIEFEDADKFRKNLMSFFDSELEGLRRNIDALATKKAEIEAAISALETVKVISDLKITLTAAFNDNGLKLSYPVFNYNGDAIGEILLDTSTQKIFLVDANNEDISIQTTDVKSGIIPFLKNLDTATYTEKKSESAMNGLKETIADKGFKLLLKESGFSVPDEPFDDGTRIFYNIYDPLFTHISSLVVEKATGVINIVEPGGKNAQNILFFDPQVKKKTFELPQVVPNYKDDPKVDANTFNILIAGKHGSLIDTMIFAHIDELKREIRMVSIPRDLFYMGRKINSLAYYYGMPELIKGINKLSGYQLDKYILIDMYSFIDVVDLVGGIDITLKSALVDPTYRTVDNGVEGTLHYEPGDYHLGGKEALRLARSRHTSTDFARAERQQLILQSLQKKAQNFGFGDAKTIYEIAKTILSKTETDISLDEAITYYFRYQNFDIVSNDVISTRNILYVPPYITKENCNKLIEEAEAAEQEMPDCENQNDAYTLAPKDDNWNLIKWFFRKSFSVE